MRLVRLIQLVTAGYLVDELCDQCNYDARGRRIA